jgi:hypothetical protein
MLALTSFAAWQLRPISPDRWRRDFRRCREKIMRTKRFD